MTSCMSAVRAAGPAVLAPAAGAQRAGRAGRASAEGGPRRRRPPATTIPIATSTARSPTSRSSTCRPRCGCRSSRARSASPTASAGRSARATSASWPRTLFGLDSGAQIGLEYRFGLMRGLQVGIHRTSDRTIEFFTQYSLLQQPDAQLRPRRHRLDRRHRQLQGQLHAGARRGRSRASWASYGALYVEPIWVNNSNLLPSELVDDNDTFMVGLGARIRDPADGVPRRRVHAAHGQHAGRATTARSASRSWPAATRSS